MIMLSVIIATHGPLAGALLDSAEMVYGHLADITPISLDVEAGIEEFRTDFTQTLATVSEGKSGVLVLCDMQGGTPYNVACYCAFSPQNPLPVAVISGVNLPMLLMTQDLLTHPDAHAAAALLVSQTQEATQCAQAPSLVQSDDF